MVGAGAFARCFAQVFQRSGFIGVDLPDRCAIAVHVLMEVRFAPGVKALSYNVAEIGIAGSRADSQRAFDLEAKSSFVLTLAEIHDQIVEWLTKAGLLQGNTRDRFVGIPACIAFTQKCGQICQRHTVFKGESCTRPQLG